MPAPGDQHTSWANPFEDAKPRISNWAAKDIATISSKLDKQLGPEYISSRAGPGGARVHYLTAEKVIGLANEVFGFNGWSSSIQNIQVDFADENPQTQRVSIGLSVIVRVTLRDGTFHEDIGYGSIENAKGKAVAFEKAKKEGTTDGLKRALRSFGNVLGNCIYDQDYVKQVTKVKAQPIRRFDQDNLHRHSDFVKKELMRVENHSLPPPPVEAKTDASESFEDFLGELDEADFCVPEDGHPDEVMIHTSAPEKPVTNVPPPAYQSGVAGQANRVVSGGSTNRTPQTPNQTHQKPAPQNGAQAGQANRTQQGAGSHQSISVPQAQPPPQIGNGSEPVAFFSARAVKVDPELSQGGQGSNQLPVPQKQHLFNPKAESPSIRKTPGIDHSSSKPVGRSGQHVPPASSQASTAATPVIATGNTSSFTPLRPSMNGPPTTRSSSAANNPSLDQTRRIGAPGGPGSPLANRGSYRPPTMKRPLATEGAGANAPRAPLVDMPTNITGQGNGGVVDGLDSKRQRTT